MSERAVREYGGGLIDVTGLSLGDLEEIDGSSLATALRRVVSEADSGPVAGFQSSLQLSTGDDI
ncbi:FxSxx-COOH cyclophane-containing RiPP peptide [Spongiactinospora sp. TRM90649]|uniref:FxSxx-COOH cyclophane-containing RiPP peptide n=1 Tax=Spongiactinospora sp. TRM90649 TaxID=3031114 RepID=UPI0023F9D368|nr:FxSxx-COOH cyclophane-containing RiPP peptide [Spongiactinospora sp. TRM90649]MDF5752622.1 FxSxx-COOH protein [Spongiactinospora sp. TRM90649]